MVAHCSLCDRPVRARGYCSTHWSRWYRWGNATITHFRDKLSLEFLTTHVKVDDQDTHFLSMYPWRFGAKGYLAVKARTASSSVRKTLYLHRLIADAPIGKYVDHINGNKLDNRRTNLRVCEPAFNSQNRVSKRHSKSGVRGVYQDHGKWSVSATVNYRRYRIGTFENLDDATVASRDWRIKNMPGYIKHEHLAV
jgi:hypothetical protein